MTITQIPKNILTIKREHVGKGNGYVINNSKNCPSFSKVTGTLQKLTPKPIMKNSWWVSF